MDKIINEKKHPVVHERAHTQVSEKALKNQKLILKLETPEKTSS